MNTEIVGTIKFGNHMLHVYSSLDEPLFRATDVADIIEYSNDNTFRLLGLVEEDEKLNLPVVVAGQRRNASFVTETGLYNILAQSRMPIARAWRRVVHTELVELRKQRGLDISQRFNEWNDLMGTVYFDEESGRLMQSVTIPGGDVEQIPWEGK